MEKYISLIILRGVKLGNEKMGSVNLNLNFGFGIGDIVVAKENN